MSYRRDSVLKHIGKERSGSHFGSKGCVDRLVYEVDEGSFAEFKAATGNPAVEFLPLKPLGETETDQQHTHGREPTENPPPGRNPGDNRRGEKSPDAAEPSPVVYSVEGEQKREPASAAVRLPLSRRARKEQHRLEREERKEAQRLERQADRARNASRAASLAASSVDLARQPAVKRKDRDDGRPHKDHKREKEDRSSAKRHRHRSQSSHSAPQPEAPPPDLRVKLHQLKHALSKVDRSKLSTQVKAASATPASSTSATREAFPPLSTLPPESTETYATMTPQEQRVLAQPTVRIPLYTDPRTLPRVAPAVFVEKILRVEAELQEFYRWMVDNHPNEEVETRLELITMQLADARRHALRPADREHDAVTTALARDLRRLQAEQSQQAATLRSRSFTPAPWTEPASKE